MNIILAYLVNLFFLRGDRKMKNKPFQVAILATLVVFGVITAFIVLTNDNSSETAYEDQPSIEGQPTMGNTDSPVQVVEFGDFKCPSCKAWGETIYPQLVSDYVEKDLISFSYINVLFHGEESKLASLAAETIYKEDPESYWDFHTMVYDEQAPNHDDQWVTPEKMLEVAEATTDVDLEQ